MRVASVLRSVLGLAQSVVIGAWELMEPAAAGGRHRLVVRVRVHGRHRGRCGKCGSVAPFYDQGGGERRWRHVDVGFATCELVGPAVRVLCPDHGVTVAQVPWARHDSAFTRAFEDVVVHDAVCSSKLACARRYGISWRAVNAICVRVAEEMLGRLDLLDGLVAVAIDEVKYKKGQRCGLVGRVGNVRVGRRRRFHVSVARPSKLDEDPRGVQNHEEANGSTTGNLRALKRWRLGH